MRFELEVYGDELITRQLLRISERTVDFMPVWGAVADDIRASEEELFDTQGASSGRPWAQITEHTLVRKLAAGLDPRILHATHALRDSLTLGTGAQPADDQILVPMPTRLLFGSAVEYAGAHQNPRDSSRKQRRPLDFNEHTKQSIIKRLQRWALRGEIRRGPEL